MLAFAPLDGAVAAASAAVSVLADAVGPLAGTAATAAAIVLFTIAVRLLISPLTLAQVRGQQRQAALAPKIQEIQKRYADQPDRLRTELVALYQEAGASPLAGCLPALLQAPFFFVMYRLFTTPGEADGLLSERLFGVPLGHHVGDGLAGAAGPLFGVLVLLLVGLAWLSSRRMRRAAAGAVTAQPAANGSAAGAVAATSADGVPAAATNPLAKIMPLLPYGTPLIVLVAPLAAVIYLVTTTAWTALEQAVLRRG
ncbi:YidC/Oxa1 family membrane protein insertase [Micromonospora polyrhachis]|uniref:Membrane protein insertase YidC n=1 Tax=Micromonospora polyrhachis TaxID=1282883 RepID=A0A7W7SSU5_9ACTN|nr:YidC/Oxa1 family membrane protein insertase [Micromonospora polyrhachis]MBB4960201.1 YidC/Oxa1 family membrane protein insertase [Micromonospora polyrhachis]